MEIAIWCGLRLMSHRGRNVIETDSTNLRTFLKAAVSHRATLTLLIGLVALLPATSMDLKVCQCGATGKDAAYAIGPDDKLLVHALHADEIGKDPITVDSTGYIELPFVGRMKAGGLTPDQLRQAITERLKRYFNEPEVEVTVAEYKSQPVSVWGALKAPGVYQLHGRATLVEILSAAGGTSTEAGYRVRIARQAECGPIPVAGSRQEGGDSYVADLNLSAVMEAKGSNTNIAMCPNDVVTVPKAKLVYVIGEVHKAGGFVLDEQETMSVLKALSLAEGLQPTAGSKNAKILRSEDSSTQRLEVPVNLSEILQGKKPDIGLHADDILFVPNSAPKSAGLRAIEAAIQAGTGVVIWRH
jgi:polysaccharide biosynthesis/export protein